MKKTVIVAAAILAAVLLCTSCGAKAPASWTSDYAGAIETAKKNGSNILLYVSGHDEEGVCQNLTDTIMHTAGFLKAAKGFVAVQLDVDLSETADEAEQNEILEIGGRLGLQYYPTIICLTPDERVFADIFYDPDSSTLASMTADLKTAAETAKTVAKLTKTIEQKSGVEKAEAIDILLKTIPEMYINQYMDLAVQIPELDPENKTGIVGTYRMLFAYNEAMAYLFSGDYESAVAVYDELATDATLTPDDVQQAYFYGATLWYYGQDWEQCINYLQKAYEASPDSENAARIYETFTQMQLELELIMTGETE